jgi:hypothetical protein
MRSDFELLYALCLLLAMVAVAVISIVLFCFAYFRIDDISNGLTNSKFFLSRKSMMGNDPFSRFFIILSVGVVFAFPSRYLKSGELDIDDYKNFPAGLMVMIKVAYLSGLLVGLLLFVIVGFGKWMGWVK